MSGFERKTLIVIALAVLLYAGAILYADIASLGQHLSHFAWWTFALALGLSLAGYGVRALRWRLYLRRLSIEVPWIESVEIFIAGFAFSATPGKVGELVKSWLLKARFETPISHSAPIVLVERLTDFLGLSILALIGVQAFHFHTTSLLITMGIVLVGTLLLASEGFTQWIPKGLRRLPLLKRIADRVEELLISTRVLLRPGLLTTATLLSVLGWSLECVGFYFILLGLGAEDVTLMMAIFIHASASILGAVSMLPGGVGLTEALMISGLLILGVLPDEASALAATLLNRLATLWLAVVIGFVALIIYRRRHQLRSYEVT